MFEALQDGLGSALKSLRGQGKLSESNMRDGLKLVEKSLLEADVSFQVVRDFMARVSDQAVGEKVLKALNPSQQVVGIVYQELINLMGPVDHSLHLKGSGRSHRADDVRPAGLRQNDLHRQARPHAQGARPQAAAWSPPTCSAPRPSTSCTCSASSSRFPFISDRTQKDPVAVCQAAIREAKKQGADTVILDTAGRLHVDQELMGQLERIDRQCMPQQVYLVVDGMTGQDAVNSAKVFNEALELDGVIMTKLDGDARGGAALSVKQVTGVPIKFIGTGEHLDALEEFHPDRMAGRILGQGDLLSLVEKAQQEFDQDEMLRQEERLRKGEFTLDDFRKQLSQMTKLGPLQKVMGLIPGMSSLTEAMGDVDPEQDMKRLFGIIDSMTAEERRTPIENDRPKPPPPHRRGCRRRAARSQRAREAVRRDGPDHDQHGRQGHEGPHENGPRAAKRHDEQRQRPLAPKSRHRQTALQHRTSQAQEAARQRNAQRKRDQRRGS